MSVGTNVSKSDKMWLGPCRPGGWLLVSAGWENIPVSAVPEEINGHTVHVPNLPWCCNTSHVQCTTAVATLLQPSKIIPEIYKPMKCTDLS